MTFKKRAIVIYSAKARAALGNVVPMLHSWWCDGCEDAARWCLSQNGDPPERPAGWLLLTDGVHCLCPKCAEGVN